MKTDRLQIRMDYIEERDKPYRNETEGKINYTEDYVKWLEDKLVNNINYTHCCKSDSELLPTLLKNTNRVEVIDQQGRTYVNWKPTNKVELSFQDDKRTLKVFIND